MKIRLAHWTRHGVKTGLIEASRRQKRLVVMSVDLACLLLTMFALLYARRELLSGFAVPDQLTLLLCFTLPFLSVAMFYTLGLYRLVTRHIGQKGFWRIGYSLVSAVAVWSFVVFLTDMRGVVIILPRSVIVSYWLVGWAVIWFNRQFARWWLQELPLDLQGQPASENRKSKKNVIIYGAGESGLQLCKLLSKSGSYKIAGFLDDDASLWGLKTEGYKVHPMDRMNKLIANGNIEQVFIANPQLSKLQKRNILHKLEPYPVEVKILPSLEELATGRIEVSDIRHIDIDDLLGRDPVQPFKDLMKRNIIDKIVMVTGAGGSIGSEISRQVIKTHPSKLILLELSELALYTIEAELAELVELEETRTKVVWPTCKTTEIISVLGSVGDEVLLRELLRTHKVDTVYHTAAYKHIPLLEKNPVPAIENNVFATVTLARVLMENGVGNMVLISSDKAVRPANIKGASNRLQELILQAMAADKDHKTVFSIVRFGNVLDSSGSVVPKFREQIKKGGPVTVTHHEIIRYFMSIREAAQLVIQAGAMARGGEVYVLDMGEPVKIDDLARTMIRLSGKDVCDEGNPNGDIEVQYIGLRPGDKMYEELLIEGNVIGSRHPYIMRLSEPSCIGMKELTKALEALGEAMRKADIGKLNNVLQNVVEGYGEKSVLQDMQKRGREEGADRENRPAILH